MDLVLLEPAVSLVEALHEGDQLLLCVAAVDILEVVDKISVGFEVTGDECGVDADWFALAAIDCAVSKLLAVDIVLEVLLKGFHLVGELEDVDVVEVVEVFAVEAAKGDHATTHKASAVSSPRFRQVLAAVSDFHAL